MAVKLRLKRVGRHKNAQFRIVAADSRSPRDGKILENIGAYDPNQNPAKVTIDEEMAFKWLNNGAQMTETTKNLFQKAGILEKFHNEKVANKSKKEVK